MSLHQIHGQVVFSRRWRVMTVTYTVFFQAGVYRALGGWKMSEPCWEGPRTPTSLHLIFRHSWSLSWKELVVIV